jgi:hypothetical protein
MTYQLWDKKTPIYDISAEQAMNNNPKYRKEDSYIFYNDDGSIHDLLALSMIPNPDGLTDANAICQAYINQLTAPEPEAPDEIEQLRAEISELKTQIAILEADNAAILYTMLTGGTV